MSKDYRLKIKIVNNRIIEAMEEKGIKNAAELSRLSGVSQSEIGQYLNMKISPLIKGTDGKLCGHRVSVDKLCFALDKMVDELFSDQQLHRPVTTNMSELKVSDKDVIRLMQESDPIELLTNQMDAEKQVSSLFSVLTERQQTVMGMRYGLDGVREMTLCDIGRELDLSNERVRQILAISHRKVKTAKANPLNSCVT